MSCFRKLFLSGLLIISTLTMWAAGCRSRPLGSGAEGFLSPYPCVPGVCAGCCGADGKCYPGNLDNRCGNGGEMCADCAVLGGNCHQGECWGKEECGPLNCPGCCNQKGDCLEGGGVTACGSGGEVCKNCEDLVCENGKCVEGCRDMDGDGYGPGCALGEDCDDMTPGIAGPCRENGCPQGWAYVPAGEFIMGCNYSVETICIEPVTLEAHIAETKAYCIEITEVSVGDFRACQDAGYCPELPGSFNRSGACNWSSVDRNNDLTDHPMNCVDWVHARQYCQNWLGGDLPTEKQWEKATRGTEGYLHPWGNEPTSISCDRCNYNWCINQNFVGETFTWPVGYLSGPEWDSPYGLKDVCGNVSEMMRTTFDNIDKTASLEHPEYKAATRGNSGQQREVGWVTMVVTFMRGRSIDLVGDAWPFLGFRCVRELPDSE